MKAGRKQTRLQSLACAVRGVYVLLKTQTNAKVHAAAAGIVCVAGLLLSLNPLEWCALWMAISVVCASEALNTALEFLCDQVSPAYSSLVRDAKDVAAAGVLIACICAAFTGLLVFLPRLITVYAAATAK